MKLLGVVFVWVCTLPLLTHFTTGLPVWATCAWAFLHGGTFGAIGAFVSREEN